MSDRKLLEAVSKVQVQAFLDEVLTVTIELGVPRAAPAGYEPYGADEDEDEADRVDPVQAQLAKHLAGVSWRMVSAVPSGATLWCVVELTASRLEHAKLQQRLSDNFPNLWIDYDQHSKIHHAGNRHLSDALGKALNGWGPYYDE